MENKNTIWIYQLNCYQSSSGKRVTQKQVKWFKGRAGIFNIALISIPIPMFSRRIVPAFLFHSVFTPWNWALRNEVYLWQFNLGKHVTLKRQSELSHRPICDNLAAPSPVLCHIHVKSPAACRLWAGFLGQYTSVGPLETLLSLQGLIPWGPGKSEQSQEAVFPSCNWALAQPKDQKLFHSVS